jgi:hypothetical protein
MSTAGDHGHPKDRDWSFIVPQRVTLRLPLHLQGHVEFNFHYVEFLVYYVEDKSKKLTVPGSHGPLLISDHDG